MNRIEKMPPDTWLEQMENWRDSAENTLRLLKKEMYRKTRESENLKMVETQAVHSNPANQMEQFVQQGQANHPHPNTKAHINGSISNGRPQFFYRENQSGKIIKKYYHQEEMENVKKQLQQEYLLNLVDKLEQNIVQIDSFVSRYKKTRAWTYFETLSQPKQMVLTPLLLPDSVFAEKWQAEEYPHKCFSPDAPEHFTCKGERVRSKSEVIIADTMAVYDVAYKYEMPVQFGDICLHPDFCCLNLRTRKEILWEHLGMMDDSDYVANFFHRLQEYEKHGYYLGQDLIITWETAEVPFNREKAEQVIQRFLI